MRKARLAHLLLAAGLLAAQGAAAESSLRLPVPEVFGAIAAGTYDQEGHRLGDASVRVERLADGGVRVEATSGISNAARTRLQADLAPLDGNRLRLLRQESRSSDEQGRPLGVMSIDHEAGFALCTPADGGAPQRLELPEHERVANVPLTLLFQPLVAGEVDAVDFQILLCRAGVRVVDAHASLVGSPGPGHGPELLEVRYDIDLGPVLSRIAEPFLPRLSVWFDPSTPGGWAGHRMPLFATGPTVLVVRAGLSPTLFVADR